MINCQNSNCCVCPNFISTTAIAQVGTSLVLTLPTTVNLFNNEKLCVAFAQNVPNLTGIPNIVIQIAGINYPVIETQTCGAHLLYADQLKQCNGGIANRQILSVKYSADLLMFTYVGCRRLCKTNATVETTPAISSTTIGVEPAKSK